MFDKIYILVSLTVFIFMTVIISVFWSDNFSLTEKVKTLQKTNSELELALRESETKIQILSSSQSITDSVIQSYLQQQEELDKLKSDHDSKIDSVKELVPNQDFLSQKIPPEIIELLNNVDSSYSSNEERK